MRITQTDRVREHSSFRYLGARTRTEFDAERTAIKALRGDFTAVDADPARALDAAGKR